MKRGNFSYSPKRSTPVHSSLKGIAIGATMNDAFRVFGTDTSHEVFKTHFFAEGQATSMIYR